MTLLQFVGILFGLALVSVAVLFALGLCQVAGEADEQAERIAESMKEKRE